MKCDTSLGSSHASCSTFIYNLNHTGHLLGILESLQNSVVKHCRWWSGICCQLNTTNHHDNCLSSRHYRPRPSPIYITCTGQILAESLKPAKHSAYMTSSPVVLKFLNAKDRSHLSIVNSTTTMSSSEQTFIGMCPRLVGAAGFALGSAAASLRDS